MVLGNALECGVHCSGNPPPAWGDGDGEELDADPQILPYAHQAPPLCVSPFHAHTRWTSFCMGGPTGSKGGTS